MSDIPAITTEHLKKRIDSSNIQLIDTRDTDSYNGWRLNGEKRGGHIPGARSFPHKWLEYLDWPDLLHEKQLDPGRETVIYGSSNASCQELAEGLRLLGFSKIKTYADFIGEWCENDSLPLETLSRFRQLVPPAWLDTLLKTGSASEYNNDKYVLCHAHYQNRDAYDQGHIPGAIEIDTNLLESQETWNRRTPEELLKALLDHGITKETTVVLYGRFSSPSMKDPFPGSSAGHLGAMRAAFLMLYAGVEDVRILNGGLYAWEQSGLKVSVKETRKQPATDFGVNIPARPDLVIDTPEAKDYIARDDANLVSIRSWAEFIGEVSGYHYIKPKGRIPGAVFGNCGTDAYHMENYRNGDHTIREFHEVQQIWAEAGITPDKRNAFYCGTGWRGSEAFMNAWLMGWSKVAVYDGGWYEWSNDPKNQIETGIPGK